MSSTVLWYSEKFLIRVVSDSSVVVAVRTCLCEDAIVQSDVVVAWSDVLFACLAEGQPLFRREGCVGLELDSPGYGHVSVGEALVVWGDSSGLSEELVDALLGDALRHILVDYSVVISIPLWCYWSAGSSPLSSKVRNAPPPVLTW